MVAETGREQRTRADGTPPRAAAYAERIGDLYRAYLEATPPDARFHRYIHAHSRNRAALLRHVGAFLAYAPWLDGARTVLDWGCRQAVDACLVRMHLGSGVELFGCDIDRGEFGAFHDFAGLRYTPLDHPWRLPYADERFDVVIGSGTLEHAANDMRSLEELWRVLRPQGRLILTFLPNAWSWTEGLNAALGNEHHHRRYRRDEVRRMLLHSGFRPDVLRYHQLLPTATSGHRLANLPVVKGVLERAFQLNDAADRVWPLNRLAANHLVVARKVPSF